MVQNPAQRRGGAALDVANLLSVEVIHADGIRIIRIVRLSDEGDVLTRVGNALIVSAAYHSRFELPVEDLARELIPEVVCSHMLRLVDGGIRPRAHACSKRGRRRRA